MWLLLLLLSPLKSNRWSLSSSLLPLSGKVGATGPVGTRGAVGAREAAGTKRGAGGRRGEGRARGREWYRQGGRLKRILVYRSIE